MNTDTETGVDREPVTDERPGKIASGIWRALNVLAAILTLLVLFGAVLLPPAIGRGGTSSERVWQVAAVLVLLGSLIAISKKVNLSILYLALACAFFFASCVSNFHWKG